MQVGTVGFELGLVGDRTDQRVAESVLSRRSEADLINQLDTGQYIHHGINAQRGEQLRCEPQPDHRRGVQCVLGVRFEASMRAAMAACSVAGTLTSAMSVPHVKPPR